MTVHLLSGKLLYTHSLVGSTTSEHSAESIGYNPSAWNHQQSTRERYNMWTAGCHHSVINNPVTSEWPCDGHMSYLVESSDEFGPTTLTRSIFAPLIPNETRMTIGLRTPIIPGTGKLTSDSRGSRCLRRQFSSTELSPSSELRLLQVLLAYVRASSTRSPLPFPRSTYCTVYWKNLASVPE